MIRAKRTGFSIVTSGAACVFGLLAHNDARAISGGQPERGYPEIGLVGDSGIELGDCTGVLIDPNWILTAGHCSQLQGFVLGSGPEDFARPVALDIAHRYRQIGGTGLPTDIALIRLSSPITSVAPAKLGDGAPLQNGERCVSVGYGFDGPDRLTGENRRKRSAAVTVVSDAATVVTAIEDTGIIAGGDSGGPLLCGGKVVALAVASGAYSDDQGVSHRSGTYLKVDPTWITQTMANPPAQAQTNSQAPSESARDISSNLRVVNYSGDLCPAGSLLVQDGMIWGTATTQSAPTAGVSRCSIQLSVEVPAGYSFDATSFCTKFATSERDQTGPVTLTFSMPGNAPETAQHPIYAVSPILCDDTPLHVPTCSDPSRPTQVPIMLDISAPVRTGEQVELKMLAVNPTGPQDSDLSRCDGAR